jgi:agmatinase
MATLQEKLKNFDPNGLAEDNGNIYGLPFNVDDAKLVILPVPWEVTVSYASGTADGPAAIFEASKQVDLFDPYVKDAWKLGLAMDKINDKLHKKSNKYRKKAEKYLEKFEEGITPHKNNTLAKSLGEINTACGEMVHWVKEHVGAYLDQGKIVALLGGDHSTPLGYFEALAARHKDFGILQIDAHADLREAYEGFIYSHASIMYNAIQIPEISKLVQVGIRDYCEAENNIISENKKVKTFFDHDIKNAQYEGKTWSAQCKEIVKQLPKKVYLSFDIDGLDPKLCPNTGTPVAGGFETEQVLYLIREVIKAKKQIIGFDINEVAPGEDGEWDANVAARLLYRISNLVLSQGIK